MNILKLALIGTLRIALFGALKVALFAYILFLPDTAYSGAKPERNGHISGTCLMPHRKATNSARTSFWISSG